MQTEKNILVVDDDTVVRELLVRILRSENYAVGDAADGAEALAKLQADVYDLVLLDLGMPGMSGVELYESITRCLPSYSTKVVVMTGDFLGDYKQILNPIGDPPIIIKPFGIDELLEAVCTVIGTGQTESSLHEPA